MLKDIVRCFKYNLKLYSGHIKYLIFTTIIGFSIFLFRPIFLPIVVGDIFKNLQTQNIEALTATICTAVLFCIIITIMAYFLILYADAWTIYLVTSSSIHSFKTLYKIPIDQIRRKFNENEQFNRIVEGCDGPASCSAIIVQCIALNIGIIIILIGILTTSKMLFIFSVLLVVFEIIRVSYEIKKNTVLFNITQQTYSGFCGHINNVVDHLDQIMYYEDVDGIMSSFTTLQERYWSSLSESILLKAKLDLICDIFYLVIKVGCYYTLGRTSTINVGTFGSINTSLDSIKNTTTTMVQFSGELPEYLAKTNRYDEMFSEFPTSIHSIACKQDSQNPAIVFEHVSLATDGIHIFKDVSFTINCGDKVALIGDNGCGKTTALHIILGERTVDSGEIRVLGKRVSELDNQDKYKYIGYIPVNNQLFAQSAFQNIRMGASGQPHVLTEDFADFSDTMMEHLSAGQQRKTNILRALQKDSCKLLIVDEADAQLDSASADIYINAIINQPGTLLMITHDHKQLKKFDYVLQIKNHKISKILSE